MSSATVESRVVEMTFDNGQFEQNVQKSMSTIDKLKNSLKLSKSAKNLDTISAAAKGFSKTGMDVAVQKVSNEFNALQIMATQALSDITSQALATGKSLIKSMSTDQLSAGWGKYEQKTSSVQTLVNSTGKSVEEINQYLNKLMMFSDETSYSFTDMTSALAQMTSSGGDINKLVPMITGIANATAFAGKGAREFQSTITNLSQSYSAGHLQLQDMKSLNLMGTASKQLKETFISVAESLGKIKKGEVTLQNFDETLKKGWADKTVMEQALGKFSELSDAALAAVDAHEYDTVAEAIEALAGDYDELAVRAFKSAQEAKTFGEAIDATKDAVSSGWLETFEIIFGNYEQAKELWTDLANGLWEVFAGGAEERNNFLKSILQDNPFVGLLDEIGEVNAGIESAVDALNDYDKIVEEIIGGKWGNGTERWDALTQAGYDWAHAQNLVNEKLGSGVRHQTDYEEQTNNTTKAIAKTVDELAAMSDAELKDMGYKTEQIRALRELAAEADRVGMSISEFIDNVDNLNGRTMIIDSIKNACTGVAQAVGAIKRVWEEVFYGGDKESAMEKRARSIYNVIAAVYKFSKSLALVQEEGESNEHFISRLDARFSALTKPLKVLFSILSLIKDVAGGGLTIAFKILTSLISLFTGGVSGLNLAIGDTILGFIQWIQDSNLIGNSVSSIVGIIDSLTVKIRGWIDSFANSAFVATTIEKISTAFKDLATWVRQLFTLNSDASGFQEALVNPLQVLKNLIIDADYYTSGMNIVQGLANGILSGAGSAVSAIISVASQIISNFCATLEIASPSKKFYEFGVYIIQGLVNAFTKFGPKIADALGSIFNNLLEDLKKTDFGSIKSLAGLLSMLNSLRKMANFFDSLSTPFERIGEGLNGVGAILNRTAKILKKSTKQIKKILGNTAKAIKSFGKVLDSIAFDIKAKGLLKLAIAMGILTACLIALTLVCGNNPQALWESVKVISVMAAVLVALGFAVSKMSEASIGISKDGVKLNGLKQSLLGIAVAIGVLAAVVAILGRMNPDQFKQGMFGMVSVAGALAVFMFVMAGAARIAGKSAEHISKFGSAMIKISISMLILVGVIKLLSTVKESDLTRAYDFASNVAVFLIMLGTACRIAGAGKIGGSMLAVSIAMLVLIGVVKLAAGLSDADLNAAYNFSNYVAGILLAVALACRVAGKGKIAGTMLGMSTAMLILVGVVKMLGMIDQSQLEKGMSCIKTFALILIGLTIAAGLATKLGGGKSATSFLAMAVAIGILAAISVLLGFVDTAKLAKGVIAVGILSVLIMGMMVACRGVNDIKGTMIGLAAAIGVMTLAVIALSFIDPKKLIAPVTAMVAMMVAFGVMAKLAGSGTKDALPGLIVMTIAMGLMAAIIYLLSGLPIESVLGTAAAISIMMLSLGVALFAMGKAGANSILAIPALLAMTGVVMVLAVLLGILVRLDVAPSIDVAVAIGVMLLAMSASLVILGVVGSMAGAALAGVGVLLALILGVAAVIVVLGIAAMDIGFLMSLIPEGLVNKWKDGLRNFMDFIIILADGLGQAIGKLLDGALGGAGDGIGKVGEGLKTLADSFTPFVEAAKKLDATAIAGVKNLVTMILEITGASILESISSFISGSSSMDQFADKLMTFGEAIVAFSDSVGGKIDGAAVESAANAGLLMASLQDAIPKDKWFDGSVSMDEFGKQICEFGTKIVEFSQSVSGIDEVAVAKGCSSASLLIALAQSLNGFTGEGLDNFRIERIGDGLAHYSEKVATIDNYAISNSMSTVRGLIALVRSMNGFTPETVTNFKIKDLGSNLQSYIKTVSGADFSVIDTSITELKKLVGLINEMSNIDAAGVSSFSSAINTLANTNMSGIASNLSGANTQMASAAANMMNALANGIRSNGSQISTAISGVVTVAWAGVNSVNSVAESYGDAMMVHFGLGVSKSTSLRSAISSTLQKSLAEANKASKSFQKIGNNIATGLKNGIMQKSAEVARAAADMVTKAVNAAKNAGDIHSPSRKTEKLGQFFDLGFVKGVVEVGGRVRKAARSVVDSAVDVLAKADTSSMSVLSGDAIRPVITPVLDLSSVSEGANTIGSLLNAQNQLAADVSMGFKSGAYDPINELVALNRELIAAVREGGNVYMDGNRIVGYINRRLGMA